MAASNPSLPSRWERFPHLPLRCSLDGRERFLPAIETVQSWLMARRDSSQPWSLQPWWRRGISLQNQHNTLIAKRFSFLPSRLYHNGEQGFAAKTVQSWQLGGIFLQPWRLYSLMAICWLRHRSKIGCFKSQWKSPELYSGAEGQHCWVRNEKLHFLSWR
jgi:hypothetical protein